jgi:hypothetical protein
MYDFYGKPPRTKEEIREYITTWLEKPKEDVILEHKGERFIAECGFRRAFHVHTIYRSLSTNEYVWWVTEYGDMSTFPTKHYSSREALIENVVEDYFIRWNL